MELITIKQYAESQNVTYEAVRKQIVRYADDLKDHIARKGRTQYLDTWAVEFLTKRRRENPVILLSQDKDEAIETMKQEIESLKAQLMTAQNELLKSQDERLKAQDRIIELQEEAKKTLEDRARYSALLEDNGPHLPELTSDGGTKEYTRKFLTMYIAEGKTIITDRTSFTYSRELNISPAVKGQRPKSQGQG